ncbi:chromo domain-containing protein [Trichonephila clavipes]|nr:chromo domain-containing protein [Trichonephila clavipes]
MDLVPKGLISHYFADTQPEVQIENNISNLLHEKETPDDIKAKLYQSIRENTERCANYTFKDENEFEVDGKPEYRSNVVDLFSYMMKNDQRVLTPPTGFAKFYAALRHVNIPLEWIELVHSYNHSIHRAHGFEPTKVTTDDEPELYKRLYHSNVDPQSSFTAGDIVRLSKARKTFRKGYLPGWTEETFHIYKRER